ncbi:MAG: tetratricopeptide repeat protein [Chloroflexi bacterium]|nr:tetratricopeptide repeat protein [Chloroflexota bacterium]
MPRPRLLVLPFANQSGDPAQDYLSDAVTGEIIGTLAGAAPERLAVLARTTAMHYKTTQKGVGEIGRELALDYIVEGSAWRTDDVIVISARLIQTSDGTHLWTKRYEGAPVELLNIETAAAQEIAEQLGISALRQRRKPTQDMEAYNLYLRGRHCYENGNPPQSFAKAKEYFEQALGRDPEFALAYDSLAEIYWNLGFTGFMPPKEALSIGLVHVLRAIEIDNTVAETHAMLGQFRKQLDFNWSEVRREMDLALQLNPVSPIVRQRYALTGLMPHGRIEEAVHELEAALELDPLFTIGRFWLAIMLWLGRRYDDAMQQGRFLVELDESHYLGHYIIGLCSREKRMLDEAVAAHRRSTELSGGNPVMQGMLGMSLADSGNEVEARAILDSFRERSRTVYVPPTSLAWIHLGLGESDEFFQSMDRAIDARDHMITPIKVYPFLDSIRRDPRYGALLRKMNLEM